jgi:hypothetical protein
MKTLKINHRLILGLFVTLMFCLFIPQTVFCQTEKLGIVKYTPPQGWAKTPKENVIGFTEYNQATGKFCIITLYGATPGTGSPSGDFARDWAKLVVGTMKAEANPKTDTQSAEGWTITSGGAAVEGEIGKAIGFLTVISGFGQAVSVLAVFNDEAYEKQVDAFISSLDLAKPAPAVAAAPAAQTSASGAAAFDEDGNLIIPQPLRQLTTADLAGVWIDGPNRMTTDYVHSGSGKSAGRDTTAYEIKNTFKSDGTYSSYFNSVRTKYGQESGTEVGPYSIVGRLLTMQGKDGLGKPRATKWVIRGWLELPSKTVLKLVGPWYGDAPIPEANFTDFSEYAPVAFSTTWIRPK